MDRLDHDFRDPGLLEMALTHSSSGEARDNERLEFLGDAALDLIVAEELYRRHAGLSEGDLTEMKSQIVSRRALAEAARVLGLELRSRLGPGLEGRALPRSVQANLYEAVLGAIYLDGGLEAARAWVLATLGTAIGSVHTQPQSDNNPKQFLQQVCQRRQRGLPNYVVLDDRGEAHMRAFLMAVEIGGRRFPSAWGRTRKEAEAWAAHEALLLLGEEPQG